MAKKASSPSRPAPWPRLFSLLFGGLLGLGLLKFGNPVILDRLVAAPKDSLEMMFQPWPLLWGYILLALVIAASIPLLKFEIRAPKWVVLLPVLWCGWQWLSSAKSIDSALSGVTVAHFTAAVACFFLGLLALRRAPAGPFMAMIAGAFLFVLWTGLEQHYGGLEATRRMIYEQPDWQKYPPEYLLRLAGERIFGTLVYPNALAGSILLLLPMTVWAAWNFSSKLPPLSRRVLAGMILYLGLACLYWSGSKAGWLVALLVVMVLLLHSRLSQRIKWVMAAVALAVGMAAFFIKFAPYFQRGATSVGARIHYWTAAVATAKANPILGTGPGTFSQSYQKIKPPEAEMTKLAHNDYLEQASDSGLPGFVTYTAFIAGSILFLRRRALRDSTGLSFTVWLGLTGWAAHSLFEFFLYIPALAWCAFAFLGWLWGSSENESTGSPPQASVPPQA